MMQKLEKWMTPLASAIGSNKLLIAIRDGFLVSTPLLIAGSIFLLIANFPIEAWTNYANNLMIGSQSFANLLGKCSDAAFSLMAIFATMGIGYSMAREEGTTPIFGAAVALMSWFILMPFSFQANIASLMDATGVPVNIPEGANAVVGGLQFGWLGSKGLFVGIIVSILSVKLYAWVERKGWVIKMPAGVPPTVVASFSALIPATIVMTTFFLVNMIFVACGTTAFDFIFKFLQTPLLGLGDTLGAMIIAYIFLHLFWFFGINGGSVVGAVFNPILQTLALDNLNLYKELGPAGYTVANGAHIISQQFQDLFATFGGCGSTLSLLIAMLLFCKSKRIKELGKLALVPGIFGINEPIVFGLPIVLNPVIAIPFILVPMMNIILTYLAMSMGMFPPCNGINIPWTMPVIISGFLSTNWMGALFQALLLILGVFIYLPFIKVMDKQYLQDEANAAEEADDDIDLDALDLSDL